MIPKVGEIPLAGVRMIQGFSMVTADRTKGIKKWDDGDFYGNFLCTYVYMIMC